MIKVDKTMVEHVTWEQDPESFDQRLHALGQGNNEFVIVNPKYDPWILDYIDPEEESNPGCVVWAIDNLWLVKKFKQDWDPNTGWKFVHCELEIERTVEFNPAVKFINQALRDKINNYKIGIEDAHCEHVWYTGSDKIWVARMCAIEFEITVQKDMGYVYPELEWNPDIPPVEFTLHDDIKNIPYYDHDFIYELVWFIDPEFNKNQSNEKIWLARFIPTDSQGVKDMWYARPIIKYNEDLPPVPYNNISIPQYYDLNYDLVWYLDPVFNTQEEKIWVAKINSKTSQGTKDMGYVAPLLEFNSDLPDIEFRIENFPKYHDFNYELVWYLDPRFNLDNDEKIWAMKISPIDKNIGVKDMGYVSPVLEFNPDIPEVDFQLDLTVPYQDLLYEHVWYLDQRFVLDSDEKIWAIRIKPNNSLGVKDMGYVMPKLEFNPDIPEVNYNIDFNVPYQDLTYEHVWYLDSRFNLDNEEKIWAIRIKPNNSLGVKDMGYVTPILEFNPDIPEVNYNIDFNVPYYDLHYDHIWYLDSRYNSQEEKIWVIKISAINCKGVKDMGYVSPVLEFNPDIPDIDFHMDLNVPYQDLTYEHIWYLNPRFNLDNEEKIWAIRIKPNNSLGVKDMGYVSPVLEFNPDIPEVDFQVDLSIPYQDLRYEHIWYLNPQFNLDSTEKIWAIRIKPNNSLGVKDMGYISPVLEFNPEVPNVKFDINFRLPYQDFLYEHVWYLDSRLTWSADKIWVARIKPRNVLGVKDMGDIMPLIEYNPDIPDIDFVVNNIPVYYDSDYQYDLVWYLEDKFVLDADKEKIWAMRIRSNAPAGTKDMGVISPRFEYNSDIPLVDFDVEIKIPYQDFCYDHTWYLDPLFTKGLDKDIWVLKMASRSFNGTKNMGYIMPKFNYNPDIPKIDFRFISMPDLAYLDFVYELNWYLPEEYSDDSGKTWAMKLSPVSDRALIRQTQYKDMGFVEPVFDTEFNPELPALHYDISNKKIPYFDFAYDLVWYVDPKYANGKEDIWAFKIKSHSSIGDKHMSFIKPMIDTDVVFISYNEANAEENWQRVREKFPKAKRVDKVKGIFEAHKRAAEIVDTEMFYVVDGDAEIIDAWDFNFIPSVFDLDVVHLWTSRNPINDLEYGYGGVKLFPRKLLLEATTWRVDLTTGLGKLKLINEVSNITAFNTDPFNTWRSAFRECAKLSASTDHDAETRLNIWCTMGRDKPYGEYALSGAAQGKLYGSENKDDVEKLKLINNYEWMKNEFTKFYQ